VPAAIVPLLILRPGEHLIPHGGIVGKAGHDHGCLHEIFRHQPVVRVHIGVERGGKKFQIVLDELEARQAQANKLHMVRAACVARAEVGHAHIVERFHPGLKDRSC